MKKSELLHALQSEIRRHDFSHFIENPPAIRARRQGGRCARIEDSGEAERCFRREAERHSRMNPNTLGA
jgi:hypothetical protein